MQRVTESESALFLDLGSCPEHHDGLSIVLLPILVAGQTQIDLSVPFVTDF
jgi:hypothetical protein